MSGFSKWLGGLNFARLREALQAQPQEPQLPEAELKGYVRIGQSAESFMEHPYYDHLMQTLERKAEGKHDLFMAGKLSEAEYKGYIRAITELVGAAPVDSAKGADAQSALQRYEDTLETAPAFLLRDGSGLQEE